MGELPAPIETFRCPASGEPLVRVGATRLETPDGSHSYPVIDGVPVLIDPDRSAISFDDFAVGPGAASGSGWLGTNVARLARASLHMPPTFSRDGVSRGNYTRFLRLLEERAQDGRTQRVLVVGGATLGAGSVVILASPDTEVVETDIARGPRTQVVCDGHDLPFQDGAFDAVICQAVLEHVLDPVRVVAEIHRVLSPEGLVYSEVPFMQQVHEGAHDVTRFTLLGHRRLYRYFDEIVSGAQGGPGMALGWSIRYFFMAFAESRAARALVTRLVTLAFFWLKYFDTYLAVKPGGIDAASGTYFLGRRRETPTPDRDILRGYRGAGPRAAMLDRA